MRLRTTLAATATTAALALVLSGCSTDDDPQDEDPTATQGDDTALGDEDGAADESAGDDAGADEPADDDASSAASAWEDETDPQARLVGCAAGVWSADVRPRLRTPWSGTVDATCDADRLVLVDTDDGETMTVEFRREA